MSLLLQTCLVMLLVEEMHQEVFADPKPTHKTHQLQLIVYSNHFGNYGLVAVDFPKMQPRLLKEGPYHSPGWSPDGNRLVCISSRRIFIMNADGSGSPELIHTPHPATAPTWSPDGKKIVYTADRFEMNTEIYVMNADGSDPVNLSNHSAMDAWTAWSPDGKTIAFTSNRDNGMRLYVISPDGSDQRDLLNQNTGYLSYPTWSPDGKMIAFSENLPKRATQISVAKSDGSKIRQLTHSKAGLNWLPAWSPDGRYIAYVRFDKWGEKKSLTGDLMLFDVVEESHTKILNGIIQYEGGRPAWKPLVTKGTKK